MVDYSLGILQKRIITNLAKHGLQNKNEIRKGVRANYKNVYYAVEKLIKRELIYKNDEDLYGLTFEGLDTALRLEIISEEECFRVIRRNRIKVPRSTKDEVLPILLMSKYFIEVDKYKIINKLTILFIEEHWVDFFKIFVSLSKDEQISHRFFTTTVSLIMEQILYSKYTDQEIINLVESIKTEETKQLFKKVRIEN